MHFDEWPLRHGNATLLSLPANGTSLLGFSGQAYAWIGERVLRQLTGPDPLDGGGQLPVRFYELLDRKPGALKGNVEANGHGIAVQGPDPLLQFGEIAL